MTKSMETRDFVSGAGGNRTPVHQAENARATTIPDFETDEIPKSGRLPVSAGVWPGRVERCR
jgi:hypothetical protein